MASSRADQSTKNRSLRQQVVELQQELAVARTLASAFFDRALAMLCTAGFDGYFKQLNPMWSQVLGFAEEELRAAPFLSFVHPDDVAATVAAAEQLGSEGHNVISFENRYRWLRWSSTPDRERGLIHAVVQDITAARADEEQLRIYQQLFQHTLTGQSGLARSTRPGSPRR
jgi:PAS domain S-box-containing protein